MSDVCDWDDSSADLGMREERGWVVVMGVESLTDWMRYLA